MPELPEVETTCRGIRPHLQNQTITSVEIREPRLRWPVPEQVASARSRLISSIQRRAKYILIELDPQATMIIHLGMSGSLRLCGPEVEARKHDHIIMSLESGKQLRYHDPRRFGCWLWTNGNPLDHDLLKNLGPEPLAAEFSSRYLQQRCRGRKSSIKPTLMNPRLVVGVGNIYACEALFMAGIHPKRQAGMISKKRYKRLVEAIKCVLQKSIDQGGTTLRDFLREDGQPGYFKQSLMVYDREGEPCKTCGRKVKRIVMAQRSTYYCPGCQH